MAKCQQCGEPLGIGARRSTRFCSDRCRFDWWTDYRGRAQHPTVTCACGRQFVRRNAMHAYCSPDCPERPQASLRRENDRLRQALREARAGLDRALGVGA